MIGNVGAPLLTCLTISGMKPARIPTQMMAM
jgi:hypothetical protein